MLPWERFGGTTNAAPTPQPNTFVTPTSGTWSRFQPAAVTPAPQAPSVPSGFGATEPAPDPFAIREQRAQEAMAPAPMDLNERRQKVGKLRAKYIDYRELWDFLDQLEADEALDYFDLEKEFLYAVGEIKDQRKQQEQGAKLAEKAAKDEERRYEKFRKEQQKLDEKVFLSQRQEAEKQEKKTIDAEKFGIQQQTKLTAEQIKAQAKAPPERAQPTRQAKGARETQQRQEQQVEIERKITERFGEDFTQSYRDLRQNNPTLAEASLARLKPIVSDLLRMSRLGQEGTAQYKQAMSDLQKTADALGLGRSAISGLTLGLAGRPIDKLIQTVSGEKDFEIGKYQSGLGRGAATAVEVAAGLGGASRVIAGAGRALPAATTIAGAVAKRAGIQAVIGGVQSTANSLNAVARGEMDVKEAKANILSGIVSSAVAAPVAAAVPGKLKNAFAQVASDLLVDLASDAAFTDYLKDDGFVRWFIERELPNLVVSAAGAGIDLKDAHQQKKAIKDLVREGLTRTINLDKGGGLTEYRAQRGEGPSPEVRAQNILEAESEARAQTAEAAGEYEQRVRREQEEFRKRREAQMQAEEVIRRREAARAPAPEPAPEPTGIGPVIGVKPEDKYIGRQVEGGLIGERQIMAQFTGGEVTIGNQKYQKRGDKWFNVESGVEVRTKRRIEELENALQKRKTEAVSLGEGAGGRPPVDGQVREQAPAVKAEDQVKAQEEVTPQTRPEIITDQAEVQRIKNSITEGELILKSGRKVSGAKMSDSELNMVLRSVNNSRAKIGLPPTDVVPKFTTPPTQPAAPEPPISRQREKVTVEAAPMDVRAEAARKAKEGAVDVSGFAKLRQGFARMRENLKAQNAADRDLLAAREGEAAADRLARETEANLNATRALLRQRGQDDAQVARDMNLAIRAEGSLTVDGKTYSKENITDLGYMEARNLAKAAGITLPEGATKSQVIKALLDRTTPDMTPEQFATKYGLGGADKDRWLQNFKDAEDLAAKLGVRLDEAGLSGLGQYVSENVGYATRRYLRNIKEGFEPTPEARTKAEDIVAQSVAKRVQNLGTRASKLGIDDLNTYLNARTDEEAATVIRNLAPAQREEANDIRKAYQNLRSAVTVVSKDIGSGAVKIDVDPQQVRNIASTIVDDMLQPPRNLADSANAGAGNAINSLLRRDLKPVFRELFGEIDDPAIVAAASRENQARNVARFTALADMAKKSGFIETDAMKAKEKGWVRLASDQKIGGTVSDYDRRRFGVLAGSYAPESVKAMLTNQDYHAIKLPEVLRSVERAVNKLAGIQRGSTVNLRPKSWIRDIFTNVTTFAGGSGDLADPVTFGKHYKDAMRVIGKHAKAKVTKDNKALGETERFFRMLADKGIFRAQTSSYWDDVSDAITGSGKLATAWKTIGEGKSMFADMPVKYAAYMTRLEKAKSWGWSDDKAREWAMEGLTRHYDNRDAVPKTFRDMSRKGLMPDYLTFKYSSIRARALQTKDIFKDLQRKDIPVEYRAKMLSSYLASLAAQPIVAGTRVGGKVAKYGAVLSTLYKTSEMLSPEAEQVDDENLDGANRYFSPRYAQQDGKVYFTDTKDGKKRLTTFSLTGAITASPFEDAIVGSLQAGVNPDLDNDLVSKLFEATIGSDVPMLWNSFSEFVSGEPLLAKYDNPGFFNALANRRDALKKATLLRKRGQEEAAIEQEKIGKEYGMEALMRVAGTADIFLGPLVGAAERGRTLKAEQVRRERRMTEATEAGPRKAKGYGPEEGRPTEEYRPTLETVDIAFGQVLPFNVRIENIEDARARVYSRAANLRAGMRETSKETEEAQFEASTETKREARKTILDAYMEPWVRNARTYLSWYGEEDVDARLKDALSKANFSDWEIEYILQFSPPAQEAAPQFGPRAPSFRPPTGP